MIGKDLQQNVIDLIESANPSKFDVLFSGETINESPDDAYTNLDDLEDFLVGKELPFTINTQKDTTQGELDFLMLITPRGAKTNEEGFSLKISSTIYGDIDDGFSVMSKFQYLKNGISLEQILGSSIRNAKSEYRSFYELVDLCDYDRFYVSYKTPASNLVGRRYPSVKYMFDLIESKRVISENITLGVTFDERRKKFLMIYNPRFVLACVLEEWAVNGKFFKDLKECYVYTLGFLIAHEMSHIIRHNTSSNIGTMDVGTISHELDNLIQDSFINVSLGSLFNGLVGQGNRPSSALSIGIDDSISVRSSADKGMTKYKNGTELLDTVTQKIAKKMNARAVPSKISEGVKSTKLNPILALDSTIYIKVGINRANNPLRETSTVLNSVINAVLNELCQGKVYSLGERLTEEEAKNMQDDNDEVGEGYMLGQRVQDKQTKRLGVVVEDEKGILKVAFSDDPDILEALQNQVKQGMGGAR